MFADPVPTAATAGRCEVVSLHVLLAAAILMTPSVCQAQSVRDHVRVTLQDGRVAGEVLRVGDAGFEIRLPEGASRSISRADIRLLERRVTGSHWKQTAIAGGATLSLTMGLATWAAISSDSYFWDDTTVSEIVGGLLAAAGMGAAVGGLVGLALRWTRWEPIATEGGRAIPAIGLAVGGGPASVELGGRLRF